MHAQLILLVTFLCHDVIGTYACDNSFGLSGFLLATKIWGGSAINKWAYVACQIHRDVFFCEFVDFFSVSVQ
jgi:hypothetical protein